MIIICFDPNLPPNSVAMFLGFDLILNLILNLILICYR